jgi:hypothetical protein
LITLAAADALITCSALSALATAIFLLPSAIAANACCSDACACWIDFVLAIIDSCNASGGVMFVLNCDTLNHLESLVLHSITIAASNACL